ncbi:lipopolysaccharide/colanic/teichoic acid biosynthesis glycosyltransferase [Arenibacter algicola]|uniref:Lipopolysaccharide/colanic/teichoic acid biosynthesis glycosyltransferase n=1 Tax=Arenibacter algicola TaxID=616991 RepID=A0ABY3ABU4_9FLAO
MIYKKYFKRLGDIVASTIALLLLSPIFIIISLLLLIVNDGKPFFTQKRPGKNEAIFTILKFKSMNDKKDANGNLLPNAERLTRIGNIIRKTSLDEIPQLINVLKGDMSLIGPRPLLIRYLPYYTEEEKVRHSIRPGITGLAQVSGRNLLGWDTRLALDIEYAKNISLALDFKILLKTIKKALKSSDVVTDQADYMLDLDEQRKTEIA